MYVDYWLGSYIFSFMKFFLAVFMKGVKQFILLRSKYQLGIIRILRNVKNLHFNPPPLPHPRLCNEICLKNVNFNANHNNNFSSPPRGKLLDRNISHKKVKKAGKIGKSRERVEKVEKALFSFYVT